MDNKLTNEEITQHLNAIIHDLRQCISLCQSTASALKHYIAFKDDESKFKKHLESIQKNDKLKENDGKTEENKT